MNFRYVVGIFRQYASERMRGNQRSCSSLCFVGYGRNEGAGLEGTRAEEKTKATKAVRPMMQISLPR